MASTTAAFNSTPRSVLAAQFIRYDLYVNGLLQRVVVGSTSGEVELHLNETSTITVVAVDTADHESAPASITVVN